MKNDAKRCLWLNPYSDTKEGLEALLRSKILCEYWKIKHYNATTRFPLITGADFPGFAVREKCKSGI